MRPFVLIAGLAALAVASPMPQDLGEVEDLAAELPDLDTTDVPIGAGSVIIPFDTGAAAAAAANAGIDTSDSIIVASTSTSSKRSLERRDGCASQPAQPTGSGPKPAIDSATEFLKLTDFSTAATGATTPSGYINTFTDQKAALSGCGYMGYKTYTSYDVAKAAQDCGNISGCKGFNIFYERDPSVTPGGTCTDPPSTTNIKASFWGNNVAPGVATNYGQYRSKFQVVIAGSNGYIMTAGSVKLPKAVTGYTQQVLNDCSIQALGTDCMSGQADSLQGGRTFDDAFFDHGRCQAICDQTDGCKYFTSYMLVTNGKCGSQQCAFYKRAWSKDLCTNKGSSNSSKDKVTIQWSSSFVKDGDDGVANCPVSSARQLFRR